MALDLDLVVRSHGWYDLPPFSWDPKTHRLRFVMLEDGSPVEVAIAPAESGVVVSAGRGARPKAVLAAARRVLDLDADLGSFHALCRARGADGFLWIAQRGAGRILRAPTLFEDAVKVLATTNCSWALTRAVVVNLIAMFDRGGAFPDAQFLAGFSEAKVRKEARLGYRAPYLLRFAERVASSRLDLARWEDSSLPAAELEKEMLAEKGFGPYAVQTLGRLLGRHGRLGPDSWSRKKVAELRFKGRRVSDARVEKFYAGFGSHAGLAFWLDVTRDWHAARVAEER